MGPALRLIAAAVIGYLFGSISSAVIVSNKVRHRDVRDYGSHNAGATNMARVFGMGLGVVTLLTDGVKTAAAMTLGRLMAGEHGFILAAGFCLFGHCFPVFFKFKGGKGVAVGAAISLMIDWRLFLAVVAVFFLSFLFTRRVSVGSILCGLTFTPLALMLGIRDPWVIVMGVVCGGLVVVMHRENIKRLIRGEEKKFELKTQDK